MFDKFLARKMLNKIWKEIAKAFESCTEEPVRRELQRALNDIAFFPDILHLDDIEIIDINRNQPQLNKGGKEEWELRRS